MSVDVYINIVYIVPTLGGVICKLLFSLVLSISCQQLGDALYWITCVLILLYCNACVLLTLIVLLEHHCVTRIYCIVLDYLCIYFIVLYCLCIAYIACITCAYAL